MNETIDILYPLFDSHSHINAPEFDADRPEVVERMRQAGLVGAMVIGCERAEQPVILELVKDYPDYLYGAWALHPEYENAPEVSVDEIVCFCTPDEIVAVGETGLDYHWCKGDLTWQKECFAHHIQAAQILNKPLIIHAREAEADALEILKAEDAGRVGFVMHCYGGDLETAKAVVDAGGLVSFTGVITFKNAQSLRDVAAALPIESLMIETDCPYMAPVPFRGKRNEPSYVGQVARTIAQVKNIEASEVARITTETAKRFFKLGYR